MDRLDEMIQQSYEWAAHLKLLTLRAGRELTPSERHMANDRFWGARGLPAEPPEPVSIDDSDHVPVVRRWRGNIVSGKDRKAKAKRPAA